MILKMIFCALQYHLTIEVELLSHIITRNINVSATRGQGSLTWPYDTWNLWLTNISTLIAKSPLLYFYYQCIIC